MKCLLVNFIAGNTYITCSISVMILQWKHVAEYLQLLDHEVFDFQQNCSTHGFFMTVCDE